MERPRRRPEESMKDWRKRRQSLAGAYLAGHMKPEAKIVEKIVFRDPPVESTLRKADVGLEAAQAKLSGRDKPDAVPAELQEHVQEGETVAEVKSRFLKLYSDLGNKVQMSIAKDFERRLHESLHAKMNWITGD